MTLNMVDFAFVVICIVSVGISFTLMVHTLIMLKKGSKHIFTAIFMFAMLSILLSNVYWCVYMFMRPGTVMPIAANEMAENAFIMLLTMIINKTLVGNRICARWETVFMALFSVASVVLWIIWTGEWIQDILGGLVYGYLMCTCVRALKKTEVFKRYEWYVLALLGGVIIAALFVAEYVPEPVATPMEILSYVIMYVVIAVLFVKNMVMIKKGADAKTRIALAFSFYAWTVTTMFLSELWVYNVALILNVISLPMMFRAVKLEVDEQ